MYHIQVRKRKQKKEYQVKRILNRKEVKQVSRMTFLHHWTSDNTSYFGGNFDWLKKLWDIHVKFDVSTLIWPAHYELLAQFYCEKLGERYLSTFFMRHRFSILVFVLASLANYQQDFEPGLMFLISSEETS